MADKSNWVSALPCVRAGTRQDGFGSTCGLSGLILAMGLSMNPMVQRGHGRLVPVLR